MGILHAVEMFGAGVNPSSIGHRERNRHGVCPLQIRFGKANALVIVRNVVGNDYA
jgi:hypothetical protein